LENRLESQRRLQAMAAQKYHRADFPGPHRSRLSERNSVDTFP